MSEPLPIYLIAFEGRLTAEEKATLNQLKETEPFRILRKLLAEQHALMSMKISRSGSEREMTLNQGQLLGVEGIYNMLMTLGIPEKKVERALPIHEKILQDSKQRGV